MTACNDYSVLAQFNRGGPLSLAVSTMSLQQGQAIKLYPNGGGAPYSFSLSAGNLAYAGTSLGTIDTATDTYTAADSIGTVEIIVTDSTGTSANTLVTVLPATPGNFLAKTTSNTTIALSWTYANLSSISGFQIWQSANGSPFTELQSNWTSLSYTASGLSPVGTYYYYVVAVAGAYQSPPTPQQGATG